MDGNDALRTEEMIYKEGQGEDSIFILPFPAIPHLSHEIVGKGRQSRNGERTKWNDVRCTRLGTDSWSTRFSFSLFPRVPLNRSIFLARTPFLVLLSTRSFKRDPSSSSSLSSARRFSNFPWRPRNGGLKQFR